MVDNPLALEAYLVGQVATQRGAHGGVVPVRLPSWAEAQHDRPDLRWASRTAAGVRMRIRTRADRVTVRLHALAVAVGTHVVPAQVTVVDGADVTTRTLVHASVLRLADGPDPRVLGVEEGVPEDVVVEPRSGDGVVEVWLSPACRMELVSVTADGPVEPAGPPDGPVWLHHGSSISHGMLSEPHLPWPVQVARQEGWDLRNLSFSGNAVLDPFIGRVVGAVAPDLVTAKIGINVVNGDVMREGVFLPAVHGLLDTVRERLPEVPVVLVSAISCPLHEDTPGPVLNRAGRFAIGRRDVEGETGALTLRRTRELLAQVVEQRAAGDAHLHHLDGRALFGPDDVGMLADGLHPDQAGTDLVAARFPAALRAALGADADRLLFGGGSRGQSPKTSVER